MIRSQLNEMLMRVINLELSCELMHTLLDILRVIDLPRNLQTFLKYSHMYLKMVLQYGLPDMEDCLRRNSDRVLTFLRSLQVITRFLHSLCCHSKVQKNTAIIGQIPALRQTMEALVFRVKALLAANKCASVFQLINLPNRDIYKMVVITKQLLLIHFIILQCFFFVTKAY